MQSRGAIICGACGLLLGPRAAAGAEAAMGPFSSARLGKTPESQGHRGEEGGVGQWGVGAVNVSSPSSGVLVENSSSGVKKKKRKKKRALSGGATEKSRLAPKT